MGPSAGIQPVTLDCLEVTEPEENIASLPNVSNGHRLRKN